ncbi:MAG: MBL fold metallo-hydrolase [Williamsia sp.]|nr:MBL fold metallo-hydrolase [Williamsia sp.]
MRRNRFKNKATKYLAIEAGVAGLIVLAAWLLSPKKSKLAAYVPAKPDKKYRKPAGWKGTPVDAEGRFMNAEFPFYQNGLKLLWWMPSHLIAAINNRFFRFPVVHHTGREALKVNNTLIWLGHASFFLRIHQTNILIDPQFFNTAVYPRHSQNPVPPDLFTQIDYILLSHDHADHCDPGSMRLLLQNNPHATVITGLGMDKLVRSFTAQPVQTVALDWYEEIALPHSLRIYFVPSRHYCARLFNRFNSRLWGGFVIKYEDQERRVKTIYYGGDSGYGSHFSDIKKLFHPDLAILPIGAFLPRWFMRANHMSPWEALQAFRDSGAKKLIPMHYGTFSLSNEPMNLPDRILQQAGDEEGLERLKPGQVYSLG